MSKSRSADVDTLLYRRSLSDNILRLDTLDDSCDPRPPDFGTSRPHLGDAGSGRRAPARLLLAGKNDKTFVSVLRDPIFRKSFCRLKTIPALRHERAEYSELKPDSRKRFCRVNAGRAHRPPFPGTRYVVSAQFQLATSRPPPARDFAKFRHVAPSTIYLRYIPRCLSPTSDTQKLTAQKQGVNSLALATWQAGPSAEFVSSLCSPNPDDAISGRISVASAQTQPPSSQHPDFGTALTAVQHCLFPMFSALIGTSFPFDRLAGGSQRDESAKVRDHSHDIRSLDFDPYSPNVCFDSCNTHVLNPGTRIGRRAARHDNTVLSPETGPHHRRDATHMIRDGLGANI
ncbi:hypothetical protein DFP72DRAFT_852862 [Ephemerocybe angulata]|uniref:Uncharacterized protein n=1 Tax=Ephemerocybe angulata TaxID=980116 RepID=A0A8H6M2H1_9AGAR|nr:hypothetical protein DFP72DRAFT_852862 [Tulosesus angulatus]